MLTDEDRKLIEMETGVKQEEVHEADQREVLFHILRKVLEQDENRDIRNFYRTEIISEGLKSKTVINRFTSWFVLKFYTLTPTLARLDIAYAGGRSQWRPFSLICSILTIKF